MLSSGFAGDGIHLGHPFKGGVRGSNHTSFQGPAIGGGGGGGPGLKRTAAVVDVCSTAEAGGGGLPFATGASADGAAWPFQVGTISGVGCWMGTEALATGTSAGVPRT